MNGILISNIGNRNLKFNGDFLTPTFSGALTSEGDSFRCKTSFLLEKLIHDEDISGLEAVIIDKVLNVYHQDISRVIFVSSDMPDGIRNDQDTVFEGEILCILLRRKYPAIQFENIPFRAKVYDHDQLFSTYRNFLVRVKKELAGNKLFYCDAGGTSQQKFSMKISLEYLFPAGQLSILYVAQSEKGASELLAGESYEYRKIIDMEHVFRAISSSSYADAVELMLTIGFKNHAPKVRYVQFMESRYRLLHKYAKNHANCIINSKSKCPDFIRDFYEEVGIGKYENCGESIDISSFFHLCEILALYKRKLRQGITEQAIHFLSMFFETFLYILIEKQFGYKLNGRFYESESDKLLKDVRDGIIRISDTTIRLDRVTMPLLIVTAESVDNDFCKKTVRVIKNCNSYLSTYRDMNQFFGLDYYRNKYAHKGQAVSLADFENQRYYPEIEGLFKIFGMPDNCIYETMNEEIIELLRN